MTVLTQEVDGVLDLRERAHFDAHRSGPLDVVEDTRLQPGANSRRREAQDPSGVGHLHPRLAGDEVRAHLVKRPSARRVGLVLGQALEGDEVVDDVGQGHAATVAVAFRFSY